MSMKHGQYCNCQICKPIAIAPTLYSETWENTTTAYKAVSIQLRYDGEWYVNLISSDVVDLTDTDGYQMTVNDWNARAENCYKHRDEIISRRKAEDYPESTWRLNSVYPLE